MFKAIRSQSLIELNKMLRSLWDKGPAYKVYTALLTQEGEDDPITTVLENTLGEPITWSRIGAGQYISNNANVFLNASKVYVNTPNSTGSHTGNITSALNIEGNIAIITSLSNVMDDDLLYNASIEIRVYN